VYVTMARAQITIEYLSVYVWSAVALAVVVGVLSFLGVFNSSSYAREECQSGSQVVCTDAMVYADGVFVVKVRNDLPKDIVIKEVELHNVLGTNTSRTNISLQPGDEGELVILTTQSYPDDSVFSFDYTFTYTTENFLRYYDVSGSATTTVFNHDKYGVSRQICGDTLVTSPEQCDPPGPSGCGTNRYCTSACRCANYPPSVDEHIAFAEAQI
jgi:hypothetical protein